MDSDLDSESEEHSVNVRGIPATIILINVFDPNSRKSSEQAHAATCQLIRHYLRTQSTHYIGVSFYGTDDDNPSIFALKCVKDVFPLTSPTIDDYKKLEDTDMSSIKQSKELVLTEVLAHCSKMFSACTKQLSSRTILMLSSLDQPPAVYDQPQTLACVVDLVDSNIQLKLINISETNYDIDLFYKDFLFEANKGQDVAMPNPVWDPENIKDLLIVQSARHIPLSQLPFEISKDVSIGVKLYKLLKSQTNPKHTYLHRETNAIINRTTKTMKCRKEETNMDVDKDQEQEPKQVPLLESEILKCKEYGGEIIHFSKNEFDMMKNPFGSNMLKLLGFKPANILRKEKWFIKNCYFLFPSEEKIEGSTIAFKALYQACIETKVVAICILRPKVNMKPRIVALSPSTQPFSLNVDIGFDVIILPFVESVRDLPVVEDEDIDIKIPDDDKTDKFNMMNDIINKLIFDYKPEMFENPTLQSKYRIIEAKALNDREIAEIRDTTKPNEQIFEHLDEEKFYKLFGPFGAVVTKRTKESSTSNKKAKTCDIDEDTLQNSIENKCVDKYNMDQLKQLLKNFNIVGLSKKKRMNLFNLFMKIMHKM